MEFLAAFILSCSGEGTETLVSMDGLSKTSAHIMRDKIITIDQPDNSVTIDGKRYGATYSDGGVSVVFNSNYGLTRDFDMYLDLSDGSFEWKGSQLRGNKRQLVNLAGKCKFMNIKRKS